MCAAVVVDISVCGFPGVISVAVDAVGTTVV
jgi:hypothetical protein